MTLKQEIDRFAESHSEEELWQTIGELVKRMSNKIDTSKAIQVRDAEQQPVAYLVAGNAISNPDLSDYATFLAVTRYRMANPPHRYLSEEEFIAALESDRQ